MQEQSFLQKHIKRTNRNLLITSILLLALVALFMGLVFPEASKTSRPDDRGFLYFVLGVSGLSFLLAFWNLVKLVRRTNNPLLHPILKQLGPQESLDQIIDKIERELPQGVLFKPLLLTNSFLFVPRVYMLGIHPFQNAAWCYGQVTSHSTNGIPTGKSYKTMLCMQNGTVVEIPAKKESYAQLVTAVSERAPWVVIGYNEELSDLWSKKRSEFISMVNYRKQNPSAR